MANNCLVAVVLTAFGLSAGLLNHADSTVVDRRRQIVDLIALICNGSREVRNVLVRRVQLTAVDSIRRRGRENARFDAG